MRKFRLTQRLVIAMQPDCKPLCAERTTPATSNLIIPITLVAREILLIPLTLLPHFQDLVSVFRISVIYSFKTEMKAEYNNLYIHFVLTVKDREKLIREKHRGRIEKYITGIFQKYDCRLYCIYANPEHVHILISKSPSISENEVISRVAASTVAFINKERLCDGRFLWQDTCSAFSISKRDINKVCQYILNQQKHHKRISFEKERSTFEKFYQMTLHPKLTVE